MANTNNKNLNNLQEAEDNQQQGGALLDEQEMKIWLSELLANQKGRSEDGRVPRPNYEQMWQVCT